MLSVCVLTEERTLKLASNGQSEFTVRALNLL
jgi:hypothetical protein